MAKCPNCSRKLRLYHWKQTCPFCGVNLIYFNSNEKLLSESEKAETEHAKTQPGIDRAKASFFGSPLSIIRLVLSIIPLASLFLPLMKAEFGSVSSGISAIGIFNYINSAGFGALIKDAAGGDGFSLAAVLIILSVVMLLVCLGCLVMSLGRHGVVRNLVLDLIFLALPASAVILLSNGARVFSGLFYYSVRPGPGLYVYTGIIFILTLYNFILGAKGLIKPKYTQCLIGGLPSEEYFAMVSRGESELTIRKRMVEELTKMQEEFHRKDELARKAEEEKRAGRK